MVSFLGGHPADADSTAAVPSVTAWPPEATRTQMDASPTKADFPASFAPGHVDDPCGRVFYESEASYGRTGEDARRNIYFIGYGNRR